MEAKADDAQPRRRTPPDVFLEIRGRRAALVKALTTDVEDFYQQCDPERENLCLYGYPNEEWRVRPPEDVPHEFPEPVLGINFTRDEMKRKDWISIVAAHSDSWLLALANFHGTMSGFSKFDRNRVFDMINYLPTLSELVSGTTKKKKQEPSASNQRSKKSNSKQKGKRAMIRSKKEEEEDICGACSAVYKPDEFWIFCDSCAKWFHGNCVKITPEMAELIELYKCPFCRHESAPAITS